MKTAEHKSSTTISRSAGPFFRKGIGNGHVQAKNDESSFFKNGTSNGPVQAQLNVSQPNDPHEKEADAMANKVVQRMGNAEKSTKEEEKVSNKITPVVQKKCADCNEEENTQLKRDDEKIPVNKYVETAPQIRYDGDTMIVPVVREVVVVEKRLLLVEEVHVTKTTVTNEAEKSVPLRREEIFVERTTTER